MKKWIKRAVLAAVLLGTIGMSWAWYQHRGNGTSVSFRTARVTRGDLVVTIDATGTLEPEEVVDVGAQVAGQILTFGTDADGKTVDYGSRVEQGTILANIDEALAQADVKQAEAQVKSAQAGVQLAEAKIQSLKSKVKQAQAQLNSALAGVRRAEADLEQLKAKFSQAELDWERAQKLGPSEALAQTTYDSYQSAYGVAKANVAVGEASVLQAQADCEAARSALAIAETDVAEGEASLSQTKASLAQAETSLWRAKRNLGYCTITSPIKGVIIDRRVNIGQTVVASLNAPSLFLIAKELKRMQVWVAVNEADVARIYPGQPVSFDVDALPDETFQGEVVKVRLNASMTQNVVTYTVEIVTDNSAGRLLPYLSANVKFEVSRRDNVLLVPTQALRWTPSMEQLAPEFRKSPTQQPTPPASQSEHALAQDARGGDPMHGGVVYTLAGQYVRPIPVKTGLSSALLTEVTGEGLEEGMEIVISVQATAAATSETSNPFTPKLPAPPKSMRPPL